MRKTIAILILASVILLGLVGYGADLGTAGRGDSETIADLSRIAGWKGASPNSPETFRFVILSDRTGGHIPGMWAKAVTETNRLKPDFVITIGDLIEGYIEDEKEINRQWADFDAMTRKLDAPFFYCPGNHDVIPDACRKIYTKLHGVRGKAWYSFDYRRCHFLITDSSAMLGKDKKLAEDQWAWLKEDLACANKASDHVFVFIHHPMFYGSRKPHWKRLRAMLDGRKTTVFSGHWHSPLCHDLADGVPYLVLGGTATGSAAAQKKPNRMMGSLLSYAHVVVTGGKPTISIVPMKQIMPHDFVDRSVLQRLLRMEGAVTLGAITGAGGEVTLRLPNPTDVAAACTLTWASKDEWFVGGKPKLESLTIPAGKTAKRTYHIGPSSPKSPLPVLFIRYEITAEGRTVHHGREHTLKVRASLIARRLKGITIDGKLNDWAGVPGRATADRRRVKRNPQAWSGPEDCSMTTRIGYDDKNLYLAIDVTDDAIVTEGHRSWRRDGVTVFLDPRPAGARDGRFTGLCRELVIAVPPPSKKVAAESYPKDATLVSAVRAACRRRKGGYTVELAILFSAMREAFKPVASETLSLEIVVTDKDEAVPDAVRSRMILSGQNDESHRKTGGYAVVTFR